MLSRTPVRATRVTWCCRAHECGVGFSEMKDPVSRVVHYLRILHKTVSTVSERHCELGVDLESRIPVRNSLHDAPALAH